MKNLYNQINIFSGFKLKLFALLICLVPIGLALGPLIPELIFISSFLIFYKEIINNRKKYFINIFFFNFLIFYIYILLNSLSHYFINTYELPNFSNNLGNYHFSNNLLQYFDHQKSIIFFFRYYLYFVIVWFFLDKLEVFKKMFLFSLSLTLILISFDALFQYFTGINFLGYTRLNQHRLSGIFYDEFILGSFYLKLYFIFSGLFFLLVKINESKFNKIYVLYNIFFGVMIFLSGERSAFYLYLINIILSFIFLFKIKSRLIFQLAIILTVFISIISFFDVKIRDRIFHKTYEQIFDKDKKIFYLFSETHNGHYMSAKLMFRENFWFGVGPKNFKIKCKEDKYKYYKSRCATHPHNYYFQLFSELGFFGGLYVSLIFLLIFFKLIKSLIIKSKLNDEEKILLIGFMIFLWPIVPHGNFFNNWLIMFYIISLSFYTHLTYKNNTP